MKDIVYLRTIYLAFSVALAQACTNILVTPGASASGSSICSYNADSPTLYGVLYHYPPTFQSTNTSTTRSVYDWDSGVYMGEIAEAEETYNVVGNSNEHGLVIGETTFGGLALLAWNQTGAIIDYGSLIYITLQRAKTAREAIQTMADLMDTYGYASGGESFSLTDHLGEVWIMEVISTGNDYGRLGAVWVAQRIPDGSVAAHANQARIRTFQRDNPEYFLFAADVVDVAVFYGLYEPDAEPLDFSFSDVYDPLTFIEARQGEARVWSIFSRIADQSGEFQATYQSYALGEDLANRMPLYVEPFHKLVMDDVMQLMTSHYEGTSLDSSIDVGAGIFSSPYRPRPLVWTYKNTMYHNERSVATPKTGWNFVAEVRPWMPPPLAALVWFACDDSSTSPRVPVYASSRQISAAYSGKGPQDGSVSPILSFDLTKAFWVQNMVSNFAYGRWQDVYPVVREKIDAMQTDLLEDTMLVDERAMQLYNDGEIDELVSYVTMFGVNSADRVHSIWLDFYGELFVRFRDFYTIVSKENDPACACEAQEPGLSHQVMQRIVQETGDHYRVLESDVNSDFFTKVIGGELGAPQARKRRDATVEATI